MKKTLCWVILALAGGLGWIAPAWGAQPEQTGTQNGPHASGFTLLASRNFSQLEQIASALQRDYESGLMTGDNYLDALGNFLPQEQHLSPVWQGHVEEWVKLYPMSYAAQHTLGKFYFSYGWLLRGNEYAKNTTQKQFDDLARNLGAAEKHLLNATTLIARPFPSYCLLIRVARGLSNSKTNDYFVAAEKADPSSYWSKREFLIGISPKWGGSFEAMDEFMIAARKKPMRPEGLAILERDALFLKAETWQNMERYREAATLYRKAYHARPVPASLSILVEAADIAKKGGLTDLSIEIYGEVIRIDPQNTASRNQRGHLLETEKKDLAAAKADYLASAEAGNHWAQNRIGWWYMTGTGGEKNFDLAKKYFTQALENGNKNAGPNLEQLARLRKTHR
ncbi:MAG: DUF4034 domain-containing protein [Betaproteobacteria bacterium]|nr:DUF4034 domain-containing protein [Betaproteobacteria bacterium]